MTLAQPGSIGFRSGLREGRLDLTRFRGATEAFVGGVHDQQGIELAPAQLRHKLPARDLPRGSSRNSALVEPELGMAGRRGP